MEEFVKNNPLHPESAHYVNSLDTSSQREHVVRLIDGAAFFESWEVYFAYALREGVPITDSTITEAVQSVGLDPLSVSLWLQVIRCCPTPAAKREMFHIGLTVPLYGSQALFDEYVAFEDGDGGTPFITRAQYQAVHSVLKSEKWPDRNADVAIHAEKLEVMQQWQELFECMKLEVQEERIQEEIQMRRMDLAFRQMCVQLQDCDTCWFQYALFLLSAMDDSVGATEIALKGLQQVRGKSLALKSLVSALTGSVDGEDSGASALMKQRMYAMDLSLVDTHSEQMKLFRSVGKAAAQKGYGDWKLYSQWSMTERSLLADPKMAVKVFDNGMKCCSQSVNSSVLLGNEAIEYHLLHRQERETVGRSEQQVELLSSSMHRGRVRASWNSLVRAERELGLHFSSAHSRKLQKFPQSRIVSFLESYRVGDFCPCDDATFSWLEFVGDYDGERGQDAFRQVEPSATKAIAPNFFIDRDCERPEESCWDEFVPMRNEAMSRQAPNGDADKIVGPRDLRGRWVYRVKLDEVTEKRMAREQKKKLVLQQSNIVNDAPDSALTAVVRRVQSLPLSAGQNSCLKAVSVDWVLELLTCDELNLDTILRSKAAVTTVRS